jgi:hypothetical protein
VQSRIKELEKIERIEIPPDEKPIHFSFPQPKASGRISGATNATLNISNAQTNDSAINYQVIITNIAGSVTSSNALLTVLSSPVIVVQPTNQSVAVGATATFAITASGAAPLRYQWRKDGFNLANGGPISGAATNVLTISDAQLVYGGSYSVVVSNTFGSVTSSIAALTVTNVPPAIVVQPTNQTVGAEATVILAVTATGTAPLSYQWWLDETNLVDGAITNVLTITNAQTTNSGSYSVVVTNVAGSVTSSNALLTVTNVPPAITVQPADQTVGVGAMATLAVTATGTAPLSYQWWLDETNLVDGAITNVLTITNAQLTNSGSYSVVITNMAGSATSSNAILTVVVWPSFKSLTMAGDSFIFSGVGGSNNGTYFVLTSSNLLLPPASWTPVATNQFDINGNFIFTNTSPTNTPQQYYLLQLP